MTRMKFMNIEIDNVTMEEALMRIDYLIKIKKKRICCYTKCRPYSPNRN